MTFEFIDELVEQLNEKSLDQENLADIRPHVLEAETMIQIFNQYEPGGSGQTEIDFLA